ncbi:protein EGG APPARATUS-1-like [Hordeum vulgare]|uniref:Predicted protein n=1 Tax=Hordeum vulgare subsp. vulgare TaxID=112509 RepID=F2EGW3_HORVV|nr:uncharacterized protein LOC123407699 [Hordeum vulgare subsp. vulgare]KAE8803550.1 protein EGG APPARATUS-1-like [Hordeum vulgare]KAI5021963.1 hypothetical protein ZWY2020_058693 [Hordeum vulgare]BAK06585.1 predicted protein [Hordeum vulgare subsp. vulgare]
MCESASLLAAAGNQDGHHHQGEIKAAEMDTSGLLDHSPATLGSTPLPSPSPAPLVFYEDDYRYYYDDDSCLQDQDQEGDDDAYQLLEEEEEDVAATGSLAARLRELVRQKLAEVNASSAVVAGLGLVGSAVGAYFLWPAAAAAATAATMAAPGAAGFFISRVAFEANSKLYFKILHTAGAAAAAAAFGL